MVASLSSPDAIRKAFFQTVLEIGQKSQKSQTRNSWLGLFLKIALIHHGQHHPEICGTIRGYFLQLVKTKSPLGGINKSCFSFSNKLPSLNLTASLHLKIDGWNTILFLFGKVYFQVRTVGFRGGYLIAKKRFSYARFNTLTPSPMRILNTEPPVWHFHHFLRPALQDFESWADARFLWEAHVLLTGQWSGPFALCRLMGSNLSRDRL